jgi:hypothetical protein
MAHEFKITQKHTITNDDIADLLTAALEGGINYWCGQAGIKYDRKGRIVGVPEDEMDSIDFASEAIGPGGTLILTDIEGQDGPWLLTRSKFIKGVKLEMARSGYYSVKDLMDNHDADTADCIVQFALFGEIVYA